MKKYREPAIHVHQFIWKKNFAPTQKNKKQTFSLPHKRTSNRNVHTHKKEQATECVILLDNSGHVTQKILVRKHEMESEC